MYKYTSGKWSNYPHGKQYEKVRENEGVLNRDGEPDQPCGVAVYVETIPKYGPRVNLFRYFEKDGKVYMGYRKPRGERHNFDLISFPMSAAVEVAHAILRAAGETERKGAPPVTPSVEDREWARHKALLGLR